MKKTILTLNIASLILFAGSCKAPKQEEKQVKNKTEQLSKLYGTENLPKQVFQIMPNRDTTLHGKNGTILRIYKHSFISEKGTKITAPIQVELQEALKPIDIVNANLMTTSNGTPLQTGGMIHVQATCANKPIHLSENCSIGVVVKNEKFIPNMKLYTGVESKNGINWINPKPLLNDKIQAKEHSNVKLNVMNTSEEAITDDVETIVAKGEVDSLGIRVVKPIRKGVIKDIPIFNSFGSELSVIGTNYFSVDKHTAYIFELKKLGWANIDRLYNDPRTQSVTLDTEISNSKDFDKIYITLVVCNMYLPGYQKKDGSFAFTHGDYEKAKLPIGAKALIFATAYKNNIPYFDIIETTIKSKERIDLKLQKTTEDALKEKLKSRL